MTENEERLVKSLNTLIDSSEDFIYSHYYKFINPFDRVELETSIAEAKRTINEVRNA